jgi:hypothetical protein
MQVTPSQLKTLLAAAIEQRLPVLITSAPGCGKSDIVEQVAIDSGAELILSHPAVADPTDAKGLPWPVKGADEATFLPFGELARALKATKPTVWFLDDLGQATPAVQASFMQLILARRVNGHILPPHVTFIAATNRRTDRAGVSGILEPVKSRFATIVELAPSVDSWSQWAFTTGFIPATLIAFLRFRPDLLSDFKPNADMTNSPMPRTWASLAKLEALQLPQAVELAAMAGAVGEGPAAEYIAFRKMFQALTSVDAILLDPHGAKLPTNQNERYAIVTALASKATEQNIARIGIIATRFMDAGAGEFAALLMRDALRRYPKLQYTPDFSRIVSGPIGQLITGNTEGI